VLSVPHTVAIICSGFNNASAAEARLFLQRTGDVGVRGLEIQAAVRALARPSEALAIRDESGVRVNSARQQWFSLIRRSLRCHVNSEDCDAMRVRRCLVKRRTR
jgi:hypothetical protein